MATLNVELCHCKNVTTADIEKVLRKSKSLSDAIQAFDEVQKVTNCSTGCGKCHDRIVSTISEMMYEIV